MSSALKTIIKVDMYPALVTAALFIGIILNDLISKEPTTVHIFIGIAATAGMALLSYRGLDYIGWVLLAVPVTVLLLSFLYTTFYLKKAIRAAEEDRPPPPEPAPPKPPAKKPVSINLPEPLDDNTVCIEYSAPPKPKPKVQCSLLADGTIGIPPSCPKSEPASVNESPPPPPSNNYDSSNSSYANGNPAMVNRIISGIKSNLTPVTFCNSPTGECP